MRAMEKDRREIIQKLKNIKDPRERDRLLWTLEGQESVFHDAHPDVPPSRSVPGWPKPERPVSENEAVPKNLPKMATDAKRVIGVVVPAFFIIFGLVNIGRALLNYFAFEEIEAEIPRLIMGGIFLIMGLTGLFGAMRPRSLKRNEAL